MYIQIHNHTHLIFYRRVGPLFFLTQGDVLAGPTFTMVGTPDYMAPEASKGGYPSSWKVCNGKYQTKMDDDSGYPHDLGNLHGVFWFFVDVFLLI